VKGQVFTNAFADAGTGKWITGNDLSRPLKSKNLIQADSGRIIIYLYRSGRLQCIRRLAEDQKKLTLVL